jgi:thioredoxin 1
VTFAEVDIDELDDLALGLGVSSIPAFHAYSKGDKVGAFTGANTAKLEDLVNLVQKDTRR